MGRTVNPLALLSVVRIRSSPPFKFQDLMIDKICFTIIIRIMRVQLSGRAPAFQAGCEGSIPFTRSMRPQLSWIEQRTSNPCVPGSNPGGRATIYLLDILKKPYKKFGYFIKVWYNIFCYCIKQLSLGYSQVGKAPDFDSGMRRFESCYPSQYDPLAQPVEHLTFNQGVRSSNLRWVTKLEKPISFEIG